MENKIEVIASKRGYIISEDGIMYNPKYQSIGTLDSSYMCTFIRVSGKKMKLTFHRLQAYQKYGNLLYERSIEVRHLDGNSVNNSWDNILIGTSHDNKMDIPSQVRIKRSLHAASFKKKYNNKEIIKYHSISKSYIQTMNHFNISSKGTLNYILQKKIPLLN